MATTAKPPSAFNRWQNQVDTLCRKRFGLSLSHLPDMLTRDAFDAGTTPQEFFEEEVMSVLREDFGSAVDNL